MDQASPTVAYHQKIERETERDTPSRTNVEKKRNWACFIKMIKYRVSWHRGGLDVLRTFSPGPSASFKARCVGWWGSLSIPKSTALYRQTYARQALALFIYIQSIYIYRHSMHVHAGVLGCAFEMHHIFSAILSTPPSALQYTHLTAMEENLRHTAASQINSKKDNLTRWSLNPRLRNFTRAIPASTTALA